MDVKVYFESSSHAEIVAYFADGELYAECLPALEKSAKEARMIVTESIGNFEVESVNVVELASELADREIMQMQEEALKNSPKDLPFPNGIQKENENFDVTYTEEAQDVFNNLYDKYTEIINKCKGS